MRIAFVIFEGMTALDFVGVFDPVSRLKTMGFLPDLEYDVCATIREVRDGAGVTYAAGRVCVPFDAYDMVVVPGGNATRTLIDDADFIAWLRRAAPCPYKVSVCSGALLLGAAGFLRGRPATTHPDARRLLAKFGAVVRVDRIVDDGDVITAGGVTAAIDLGLCLAEKLAGPDAREKIRRQMDYPYGL
ncbi:MAG: DJ-1/PfpI family protein [Dehalococcoidia bacterium]